MTSLRMLSLLITGATLAACSQGGHEAPDGIKRVERAVCRDFSPAEPMQSSDNNSVDMRRETGQDPAFKGSEGCQ